MRLEVQPLVRSGSLTVLTAVLSVIRAPTKGPLVIGDKFTARGERSSMSYLLTDVRLFAPDPGVLASPANSPNGEAATTPLGNEDGLATGDSAGLRVVFGGLPAVSRRADVLWPLIGVVPDLPVVEGPVPDLPAFGRSEPRDVDLRGVAGPVLPVTARSSELEGAVRVEQAPVETRVVLAADVLFALDRADLSAQANVALDRAAAAILAAGPGPVKVTGHTDDQGTELYNLDLSKRRAQSVATALVSRLAPDRFPLEVAGRGESEPAVQGTTPEARAANRRVELVVERGQQAPPAPASRGLPPGGGPSAKASEGLMFGEYTGSQMRIRAERAVPEGNWLRVDLTGTVERTDPRYGTSAFLVNLRDPKRNTLRADAAGVGVLDGAVLHLAGVDPTGICACDNTLFGIDIEARLADPCHRVL